MPSLADKKPLEAMRVCIVGAGGAGKTHLLGSFAKAGKLAIADMDGDGVDTLLGWRFRQANPWFQPSMVDYVTFDEKRDAFGMPVGDPQAYWALLAWVNKMLGDPTVKTIAIDSLSATSKIASYAGMRANLAKQRSKTWGDRDTLHMLLNTQADMGAEGNSIQQLFEVMKRASALNKHMVVTAHIRENRNSDGILISREPLVTGQQMRAQFANYFSDVWWLDVVSVPGANNATTMERQMLTDTTPGIKGIKSRLGVPSMMNPSYEKVVQQLQMRYGAPKQQVTPPVAPPAGNPPANQKPNEAK